MTKDEETRVNAMVQELTNSIAREALRAASLAADVATLKGQIAAAQAAKEPAASNVVPISEPAA